MQCDDAFANPKSLPAALRTAQAGTIQNPKWHSLDHLVCPDQDRPRNLEAKGLGGLEVDDQLELRRLLHYQLWC